MADVYVGETIQRWREWSSGSVDELAAIGTAFVWSLGLEPLPETTASARVSRRTIRYYISKEVMDPPAGERRLAIYSYRHLLQLLYIKARQHAGDRLSDIRESLSGRSEREIERLLVDSLPETVTAPVPADPGEFRRPAQLSAVMQRWAYLTGRQGRWVDSPRAQCERDRDHAVQQPSSDSAFRFRLEIDLGDEISLSLPSDHPLAHDEDGRDLFLRGIQRMIRNYRRGGGPAGKEN